MFRKCEQYLFAIINIRYWQLVTIHGFCDCMGSEFLFYFAFNAFRNYPQPPASHYCWIYYLCTDEQLVRGSLLEPRQWPPAQGNPERKRIPERTAIPKGKHLRMERHPERKRISERTAIPKGNASPREKRIVTLCWKVLAFSAFS